MASVAAKKASARTVRRERERATRKDVRDRTRLAAMEPGGAPDRPLEVSTASLVEPTAASLGCALCAGSLRIEEHAAETIDGVSLRVVRARCSRCGAPRAIWFRIVRALAN
jgi:hypothetical protein